ncbi:MAG TPA: cytochrome c oxidase subunit 4 [Thermoleophilaceae bacterium]|jgi:type IV secretory pathway TrbD component|nr:cytochrome c oxidase subunit 4 [Thermoleophilaceae bacterium]
MAEEVRVGGAEAEPAGEAIHLPGPSYLPVIAAAGMATVVVGVVQSWVIVVIGALIAIVATGRWISQTRQEMSELPLEH